MANARLGWFSPLGVAFRFGVALAGLAFGLTASAFRHAPLRGCPRRVGLRAHDFRFSARTASELPLGGLAFGLTVSAFRHAPLRSGCWASSFFRLPFRSCRSAGWASGSLLPLFGTRRFGVALVELTFGLTTSAFRYAPLRGCPRRAGSSTRRVGFSAFRFGNCPRRVGLRVHCFRFSARAASEWLLGELVLLPFASEMAAGRVGLRAHCFRFSARTDPHRRTAEARTDGAQRHDNCFTSKHLSQHVNLPHRTP